MRISLLLAVLLAVSNAAADDGGAKLWNELKSKRDALAAYHQEFDETRTMTTAQGKRNFLRQAIVDASNKKWRERFVSGAGNRVRIFDGDDLFVMEADADEYIRTKRKGNNDDPEPAPYESADFDWHKAKEVGRFPCSFSTDARTCVAIDVTIKPSLRTAYAGQITRTSGGAGRLVFDLQTGLLVRSDTQQSIDSGRSSYDLNVTFLLKRVGYGAPVDAALFQLPDGLREVKEFTRWDAGRIKKQLGGKPAPELEIHDIRGNPVSLSALKGKTVLLDFWTTWCPPCLADAPVLDRLYSKYAQKNLVIIGISVDEERQTVEKFLEKHPHKFPIAVTTENEMPHSYQIGLFPTYIVIGADGTVSSAFDGDRGFGELRKHLAKAGMETD